MKPHRGHALKSLEWCKKKYGKSRYNGPCPTISYAKPDYMLDGLTGYYEPDYNHIYVNSEMCNTVEELVATVIHEYQHYLQNMYHYQIIAKYCNHDNHPMELMALQVEKRDSKKCMQDLCRLHAIFNT